MTNRNQNNGNTSAGTAAGGLETKSMKPHMNTLKPTARKKQRLKGLTVAARAFEVTEHHLRLVVNGERVSPALLVKWERFNVERETFLTRVQQLSKI
jgi:hypothetical protein